MFGFFEKKETHVDEVKAPAFVEWKGWRKFKVMNRKQECVDTTTFTLMPADEQPLPAFRAGQGVALRLEGFEPRAYTLCSTPDEGCYRITIKVLDNDRGALSAQLAQCLHVGDEIEVSEPALRDRHRPPAAPRASHLLHEERRALPASGGDEEPHQAYSRQRHGRGLHRTAL